MHALPGAPVPHAKIRAHALCAVPLAIDPGSDTTAGADVHTTGIPASLAVDCVVPPQLAMTSAIAKARVPSRASERNGDRSHPLVSLMFLLSARDHPRHAAEMQRRFSRRLRYEASWPSLRANAPAGPI